MDGVAGARAGDHRRRRLRDPHPAASCCMSRSRFWVTFAAGLGAARRVTGHAMIGPLAPRPGHRRLLLVGARHLAGDPRLPVLHDHRPEDDPGVPARPRSPTPSSVGLLAALLIAPTKTEFWAKVARARRARDRLRRAAAARAVRPGEPSRRRAARARRRRGRSRYSGADRRAPASARGPSTTAAPLADTGRLPQIAIRTSKGVSGSSTARRPDDRGRPRRRPPLQTTRSPAATRRRSQRTATFDRLPELRKQIRAARTAPIVVPPTGSTGCRALEPGDGQGAAIAVATLTGRSS